MQPGVEDVVFCYLRFPSGLAGAHAPVLARPAQGAPLHGRRLEADGDLRRHGARAQADRLRQGLRRGLLAPTASTSRARATSSRRGSRTRSRCGSSAATSSSASGTGPSRARAAESALRVVRVLEACSARSRRARMSPSAELRPSDRAPGLLLGEGVELPDDVEIGGHVVVHAGTPDRRGREAPGRLRGRQAGGAGQPRRARPGGEPRARPSIGAGTTSARARWCVAGAVIGERCVVARPGARARAHRDRRRVRRGARRRGRERRAHRRARADADRRLRDGVVGGRGRRLHRARASSSRTTRPPAGAAGRRGAARADAAARLPDRRGRGAAAGRRDRRGGVRRGRRGRHARRAARARS